MKKAQRSRVNYDEGNLSLNRCWQRVLLEKIFTLKLLSLTALERAVPIVWPLVLTILTALATAYSQHLPKPEAHKNKQVLGTVQVQILQFPENDNLIIYGEESEVRIFLFNKKFRKEMAIAQKGLFELSVPPGVYRLKLKIEGMPARYQRANFRITPNQITKIVLSPLEGYEVCYADTGLNSINELSEPSRQVVKYKLPRYDEFATTWPLNVTVQYCRKSVKRDGEHYYGLTRLTFNNLTLEAEKIILDKAMLTVQAFGIENFPVWLRAGDCDVQKDELQISLNEFNPYLADKPKGICP